MISKLAEVSNKAIIGENVTISSFSTVYEDVTIGTGTKIHPNVTIYPGTTIGENIKYGQRNDGSNTISVHEQEAQIEAAAKVANAHHFISKFPKGWLD